MGARAALHQMTIDGEFPRVFSRGQQARRPRLRDGRSTWCASIALVFTGGAVEIYSLSNVGYTVSFIPVLVGYYLLRQDRPEMRRPFTTAGVLQVHRAGAGGAVLHHLVYGGIVEHRLPNAFLGSNDTKIYFFIGWVILLSYLPLYWYRKRVEDPEVRAPGAPRSPRWGARGLTLVVRPGSLLDRRRSRPAPSDGDDPADRGRLGGPADPQTVVREVARRSPSPSVPRSRWSRSPASGARRWASPTPGCSPTTRRVGRAAADRAQGDRGARTVGLRGVGARDRDARGGEADPP